MKGGTETVRIAMWSGPRNVSTALMRAWENRPDAVVTDEPFYGYYLRRTGADHPGRDEIIRAMPTDWREIVEQITGPPPDERPVWYQKHMTHHILPEIGHAWLGRLHNCFLIRDPRDVVASYERVRETATPEDLGYPQQAGIFDAVMRERGDPPARAGFGGRAGRSGEGSEGPLHGPPTALPGRDVELARRPAEHGRRLGQALVRQRGSLDRLRTSEGIPPQAVRRAGRTGRNVPTLLRNPQTIPNRCGLSVRISRVRSGPGSASVSQSSRQRARYQVSESV